MYKNYNWNTIKRHSAFDDLTHLYVCILFHIQDMQFFRFYSMTASRYVEKEKMGDLEYPKFLEKKRLIASKNE